MLFNALNFEVLKVAAKEGMRPEITGVYFTPEKSVATDSFRLAEITTPKENIDDFPVIPGKENLKKVKPFILPAESAKAVQKNLSQVKKITTTLPILKNGVITHQDKDTIELTTTNLEQANPVFSKVINGEFPDYKEIVPKKSEAKAKIIVNAAYLKELMMIAEKFNKTKQVEIRFYGEDKPIRLDAVNCEQKFLGLLMPIKET